MSYAKQCDLKQTMLEQCFTQLDTNVLPVLPAPQQRGYRNKIEFSFGKYLKKRYQSEKEGFEIAEHRQLGFHKQGEFSKVVDVEQCYLISPDLHAVYTHVKELFLASGLPVYDAKTHQGVLRHLVLRE